jgi:murein L,D-transpeptidase YafK
MTLLLQFNMPSPYLMKTSSTFNMVNLQDNYPKDEARLTFWRNLKIGYDYFENKKKLPEVTIAPDGHYLFR